MTVWCVVCFSAACAAYQAFTVVVGSITQTLGQGQGAFFDPVTMQPLFTGAAGKEVLRIVRGLAPATQPDAPCMAFAQMFLQGRCLMAIGISYTFKVSDQQRVPSGDQ